MANTTRPSVPPSHSSGVEHRRQIANVLNRLNQTTPDYSETTNERAAGVTPVNYQYEPGNVLRYGTNATPGTTDLTTAIEKASLAHDGGAKLPAGSYAASGVSDSSVIGEGSHAVTISRSATGNLINGNDLENGRIEGVTLNMGHATHGSGHGIAINDSTGARIRDVVVADFGQADGAGGGTGVLVYSDDSRPARIRFSDSDLIANIDATASVGWIFDNVDTSFATNIYAADVIGGIGYAHELKNDARHNYLGGLIAESSKVALAYGQEGAGIDGCDYNLASGLVAKACDVAFLAGEAQGNLVVGILHDAADSPALQVERTVDLQSSSRQNAIFSAVSHGTVEGPIRIDGDENFVELADFSSASETIRFQPGAKRNGVHVAHPGSRTTIRSRIVDNSGSGISGSDCNVVYSPLTGEWIGSLSGVMTWALGTPGASYNTNHHFRFEGTNYAVLALATSGATGDAIGINYAIPSVPRHASIMYEKQATASNEHWSVRVNNTSAIRLYQDNIRPETTNTVDLGTNAVRYKDTYVAGVSYVGVFTVATLPSPAIPGGLIYVSDETGGPVLAFSDGTNWRRVTDREVVA